MHHTSSSLAVSVVSTSYQQESASWPVVLCLVKSLDNTLDAASAIFPLVGPVSVVQQQGPPYPEALVVAPFSPIFGSRDFVFCSLFWFSTGVKCYVFFYGLFEVFLGCSTCVRLFRFLSLDLCCICGRDRSICEEGTLIKLKQRDTNNVRQQNQLNNSITNTSTFKLYVQNNSLRFPSSKEEISTQ